MTQSNQDLHSLIKELRERNQALTRIIEEKDNEIDYLKDELDHLRHEIWVETKG